MKREKENKQPIAKKWKTTNFDSSEFDSPDLPGSGANMNMEFIAMVQLLRTECNFPFVINSGYRTKKHNKSVKGKADSAHLLGLACDIHLDNSHNRYILVSHALRLGFRRIGLYRTFVHLDISVNLPNPVVFLG